MQRLKGRQVKSLSLWLFCALFAVLYCSVVTTCEFHGVPVVDGYSVVVLVVQWAIVAVCSCGPLFLMTLNRWVFAIVAPLLMLISGVGCYYNITIGTRLSAMTIELAMVNGADMWWSVINVRLIVAMIAILAVSVAIAWYRWRYVRATRRQQLVLFGIGLLLTMAPVCLVPRIYSAVQNRLPYSIYFAFRDYSNNRVNYNEVRTTYDGAVAVADTIAPDIVFVLGESLRADHLPMNGYERNTMPRMAADTSLIVLSGAYSEYTFTHESVPHILTQPVDSVDDYVYYNQSFITLFKKAGYRSAWFANQDVSSSYAYFVNECDTSYYCNATQTLYSYKPWLDTDMLPYVSEWYGKPSHSPALAVLHTIGSHWWYRTHYVERPDNFRPEIEHKDLGGLSHESIVNSYDNTILATDSFLADLTNLLRDSNRPVLMFFISDHGEGLGENGVYLHGTDVEPLHYPACMVWYNAKYAASYPEKVSALRRCASVKFETTQVFDTILDLAGISTSVDTPNSIIKNSTN